MTMQQKGRITGVETGEVNTKGVLDFNGNGCQRRRRKRREVQIKVEDLLRQETKWIYVGKLLTVPSANTESESCRLVWARALLERWQMYDTLNPAIGNANSLMIFPHILLQKGTTYGSLILRRFRTPFRSLIPTDLL